MKKYIFALSVLLVSTNSFAYGGFYYGHPYWGYRAPIFYPIIVTQPVTQPVYIQSQPQPVVVQQSVPTIPMGSPQAQDSSVYIGTSRIAGDPVVGKAESYPSWKSACENWKKQMTSLNSNKIISLECGAPALDHDSITAEDTQVSQGVYKLNLKN
jgi:hypothetical protein